MASFKQLLRGTVMALALSTLCVVGASAANVGVGTVTADALRMRSEASTEASILATAPKGEHVVVIEAVEDGWYKVDYEAVEGYMSGEFLEIQEKADVALGFGKVNTDGSPLNVRSAPDTDSDRLSTPTMLTTLLSLRVVSRSLSALGAERTLRGLPSVFTLP